MKAELSHSELRFRDNLGFQPRFQKGSSVSLGFESQFRWEVPPGNIVGKFRVRMTRENREPVRTPFGGGELGDDHLKVPGPMGFGGKTLESAEAHLKPVGPEGAHGAMWGSREHGASSKRGNQVSW